MSWDKETDAEMQAHSPEEHTLLLEYADRCGPISAYVAFERFKQDREWGGATHDAEHSPQDWCDYIEKQLVKTEFLINKSSTTRVDFRRQFIKIAALAFAAIEVIDQLTDQDAAIEQGG